VLDQQRQGKGWLAQTKGRLAEAAQCCGWLAHLGRGYWRHSRRPLISLVFVLPLVLAYESGVMLLGGDALRNGAEVWMRDALGWIGLRHWLVLPLLAVLILGLWHRVTRRPWRLSGALLATMVLECVGWSVALLLIAHAEGTLLSHQASHPTVTATGYLSRIGVTSTPARLASLAGAGVYEEMLFRLILLPLVAVSLRGLGTATGASRLIAVLATSLAFAAAHQLGSGHETFVAAEFLFRGIAGAVFAGLFLRRGFGIAAGTHALYDMLASAL